MSLASRVHQTITGLSDVNNYIDEIDTLSIESAHLSKVEKELKLKKFQITRSGEDLVNPIIGNSLYILAFNGDTLLDMNGEIILQG